VERPIRSRHRLFAAKPERPGTSEEENKVADTAKEAVMTTKTTSGATSLAAHPEALVSRVLVGVDRSPESLEAARQAAVLCAAGGTLTLLSAWTLPPPVIGVGPEFAYQDDEDPQRKAAEAALAAAKAKIAAQTAPDTKVARGFAWDELIKEIDEELATLVVVGSHGTIGEPRPGGQTESAGLPARRALVRAAAADGAAGGRGKRRLALWARIRSFPLPRSASRPMPDALAQMTISVWNGSPSQLVYGREPSPELES